MKKLKEEAGYKLDSDLVEVVYRTYAANSKGKKLYWLIANFIELMD